MAFLRGLSLEYIMICMYTGLHYNTGVKCLWFLRVVFSVTLCVMMACWRHHVLCSERVIFTFHIFAVVVWIVFCILHRAYSLLFCLYLHVSFLAHFDFCSVLFCMWMFSFCPPPLSTVARRKRRRRNGQNVPLPPPPKWRRIPEVESAAAASPRPPDGTSAQGVVNEGFTIEEEGAAAVSLTRGTRLWRSSLTDPVCPRLLIR